VAPRRDRDGGRRGGAAARPPAELAELQGFLAVALRREEPIPDDPAVAAATRVHVAGNERLTPEEQADIYRNQFWLRHVESLSEDHPGLRALVGEAVFEALAHAYLTAHPPRTPSLRELGADLPGFAAAFRGWPPGRRDAALEMLRYEQCFIDLFDGAEPPPLDLAKLQAMPEDGWDRARLVLHPLLARLRLEHPMHLYRLAALHADEGAEPPPFPERVAVCLVLYRGDNVIRYDELAPEAFALLEALAAGETLPAACEKATAALDPAAREAIEAKVGPWFQDWTAKRWIVDVVL
jgi:hypothetical protein